MKRMLVIPFFIPFRGCGTICVYCDQRSITGAAGLPSEGEITKTIERYLGTWKGGGRREAAFYGGTFTAMPQKDQAACLSPVARFMKEGLIDGIRVSTRPDFITPAITAFLKERGVTTVELGAQSMDDRVLRLSRRGHSAEDTARAVSILRREGLRVGLQLMPGLPGDDARSVLTSAKRAADLAPDFVRIYPTVVLSGTALEGMFRDGSYRPWTMDEMVKVCAAMSATFEEAGIRIVRMGLQYTEDLARSIVAGPYHPAFRDLVKRRRGSAKSQARVPCGG